MLIHFQIIMMGLLFLFIKFSSIVAHRMSHERNGEHYCYVFGIMIYKQVGFSMLACCLQVQCLWILMYQGMTKRSAQFWCLLIVQCISTFLDSVGLDRVALSWILSQKCAEHFEVALHIMSLIT